MFLGKVVGDIDSETNSGACDKSRLKIIQKLDLYRNPSGHPTLAVDLLGAGDGDIVIVGASTSNNHNHLSAPMMSADSVIMGILEREGAQLNA